MEQIEIIQGDITEADVDAVVNAANNDLQLGGGVAGAIRRKGGPAIQQQCDQIGPITLGGAAVTTGGNLKAKYVIHAASMALGSRTSEKNLEASVRNSLRRAEDLQLKSIAFPAIGTGIAGFDTRRCAEILLRAVSEHLQGKTSLERVVIVLYDETSRKIFAETWAAMQKSEPSPSEWGSPRQ
ncbi:MAG: macro domain-containing protein [Acidobacteria bacterium]|nr:macro domain-containing protein [Acidobacteriota bacterium]